MPLTEQIRQAVKAAPMSRNELCRRAGIDPASLSRFMAGTVLLRATNLDAVADVLGIHVAFAGAKAPKPRKV